MLVPTDKTGSLGYHFIPLTHVFQLALHLTVRFAIYYIFVSKMGIEKILIANRGEIVPRIIRTCKELGVKSVCLFTKEEANNTYLRIADYSFCLKSAAGYLDIQEILDVAKMFEVDAIHPGYGFLAENADFARLVRSAGLIFIGPTAEQLKLFSQKQSARQLAIDLGIPVLPGSNLLSSLSEAIAAAGQVGYPLLIKSSGGGGGMGIDRCDHEAELIAKFDRIKNSGQSLFGIDGVYLEKLLLEPRHTEIQIFGNGEGEVIHLGDRECSIQRRYQKLIEETPAAFFTEEIRARMVSAALKLAESVRYKSVGTVEFLVNGNEFYFIEVNPRIQVEHTVTECVWRVDIVDLMIREAAGELADFPRNLTPIGHAIEARINAEDPENEFSPSSGVITEAQWGENSPELRIDTWIAPGSRVTGEFDPLLCKVIVRADNRREAVQQMAKALTEVRIRGVQTNVEYLQKIFESENFVTGLITTKFIDKFNYHSHSARVLQGGMYSLVQSYPGRLGYWSIGIPPSGPMDQLAFRLVNRILGNSDNAAGIEMIFDGVTLQFRSETLVALGGAEMEVFIDGKRQLNAWWKAIKIGSGQTLQLGKVISIGCRSYLAVAGGFDVGNYLGSTATFPLGKLGGLHGEVLRAGDILQINSNSTPHIHEGFLLPKPLQPVYSSDNRWEIGVIYGPHGAPDFFTESSIQQFFATDWRVHHDSNRLGIRLCGPKPTWSRADGGEAGLHPSNIHDCEYAVGSVNYTGDMPIILTVDGPSLGGFVCPVTVVSSELWKVGQLKANDRVRFVRISYENAVKQEKKLEEILASISARIIPLSLESAFTANVSELLQFNDSKTQFPHAIAYKSEGNEAWVQYRIAGDKYLLIEYGEMILDLRLRVRVYALMEVLKLRNVAGIHELSPGVRSLQIHYDSQILPLPHLIQLLKEAEMEVNHVDITKIPSRLLRLPLAFRDCWTLAAIEKYRQVVRPTAPYLPDNVDFVARINGLQSADEVREILTSATYLVLGLGDVYLGAPCAVPIDPRHRLVTSKYNPARTFTPEGAVGIGMRVLIQWTTDEYINAIINQYYIAVNFFLINCLS